MSPSQTGVAWTRAALLMLALLASPPVFAQHGFAPDLPPKDYSSPSGRMSLSIDPSDRSGAGSALYELRRDGAVVWSADQPFTFWDAAVGDDGTVGGYAYSLGFNRHSADAGDFLVVILDPRGSARIVEKVRREPSLMLHRMADPQGNGVFLEARHRGLVVRVSDPEQGGETWWSFPLAGGQARRTRPPFVGPDTWIADARPVAGTDLVLVHAWMYTAQGLGGSFVLVDPADAPVWKLELPGDYAVPGDEAAQAALDLSIRDDGAILDTRQPGRFEIRHAAAALRVTYAIEAGARAAEKPTVREISRAPFARERATAAAPAFPKAVLSPLGTISLVGETIAKDSPIGDVAEFAIDDRGRIGFLRWPGRGSASADRLAIVDANGETVKVIALPSDGTEVSRHLASLDGERWLVTTSGYGDHARSSAVTVDARTGSTSPLAGFDAPRIEALARSGDGGFVALTSWSAGAAGGSALHSFDAHGAQRWSVKSAGDGEELFSPKDVTVAANGEVIVLENIANRLDVFAADGTFRHAIDLAEQWGRAPNYPTSLATDAEGGLVVEDFNGDPPILRLARGGAIRASFAPRFADGRRIAMRGRVQPGPDGRLWTSDGFALLRLDAKGTVDRVLGDHPRADALGTVAAMHVDGSGTIYAVDRRTGAVHVFDRAGARLRVHRPDPADHDGPVDDPSLAVTGAGDVFVSRTNDLAFGGDREFIHYAPSAGRVGVESVALDPIAEAWHWQAASGDRWVVGYKKLWLVGADGHVLRAIDRTASGQWLESPGPVAVAPDGRIAVVSDARPRDLMHPSGARVVAIYARDGEAVATWPAPEGLLSFANAAFDGSRFVALAEGPAPDSKDREPVIAVVASDAKGVPMFRFEPPGANEDMRVFLVQGEAAPELWLFDAGHSITRYALP
jgi:hypothetical protein